MDENHKKKVNERTLDEQRGRNEETSTNQVFEHELKKRSNRRVFGEN